MGTSPYKSDPKFAPSIYNYSKIGEIWGWYQNDKKITISVFNHKIIRCGYKLESSQRGDSNRYP